MGIEAQFRCLTPSSITSFSAAYQGCSKKHKSVYESVIEICLQQKMLLPVRIQKDSESITWTYLMPLNAGQDNWDSKLLSDSLWKQRFK